MAVHPLNPEAGPVANVTIAKRLASALNRNDEQPNIALAEALAKSGDANDIAELADLLTSGAKPIRHDAIKTLYELGERRPDLIAPYLDQLIDLLTTKDNRMLWGTMSALAALAPTHAEPLMPHLNQILDAADRSSVISKDKCMVILAALNSDARFTNIVTPVILDRLRNAAVNQTPMYAELTAPTIAPSDVPAFRSVVEHLLATMSFPAKRKRLEKVLKSLT